MEGGALQGAPQLRLVQGFSHDREQARLQARAALRSCLAQDLGCPEDALQISNQRNEAPQLWLYGELGTALLLHQPCAGTGSAGLAWRRAGGRGYSGCERWHFTP